MASETGDLGKNTFFQTMGCEEIPVWAGRPQFFRSNRKIIWRNRELTGMLKDPGPPPSIGHIAGREATTCLWRISVGIPPPPAARADQQPRRRRPDFSARSSITGLLRITLRGVLIVQITIFSKPMEQATEERYRDQVQRVFNRISLTGLPERDPGLSELPLDRPCFIWLSVEVRRVVTDLRFRLFQGDRPDGASAPDGGYRKNLCEGIGPRRARHPHRN